MWTFRTKLRLPTGAFFGAFLHIAALVFFTFLFVSVFAQVRSDFTHAGLFRERCARRPLPGACYQTLGRGSGVRGFRRQQKQ